jgi:hypothetical protein
LIASKRASSLMPGNVASRRQRRTTRHYATLRRITQHSAELRSPVFLERLSVPAYPSSEIFRRSPNATEQCRNWKRVSVARRVLLSGANTDPQGVSDAFPTEHVIVASLIHSLLRPTSQLQPLA